jgi:hypothetical protein
VISHATDHERLQRVQHQQLGVRRSQCLIEWRIEGQFDVQNTKFTMLFNSILGNKYA